MESKYVPINEVVVEYGSRSVRDWQAAVRKAAQFFGNQIMTEAGDKVVTEDIDCEIVEPRQLPAPEDPKRD